MDRCCSARSFVSLGMVLVFVGLTWGDSQPPPPRPKVDAVQALKQALKLQVRNAGNKIETDFREQNLSKHIDALESLSDLAEALLLEWQGEELDATVAGINRAMRHRVVERFEREARATLERGSPRAKEAAARLVGSLGVDVRGIGNNVGGAMRVLAPELVRLLDDPNLPVREAAASALGKTNPDPSLAVPALARALKNAPTPLRRTAAEALSNLVRKMFQLSKSQNSGPLDTFRASLGERVPSAIGLAASPLANFTGLYGLSELLDRGPGVNTVMATREDLFDLCLNIIPVAYRASADADPEVRRQSLEAILNIALAMSDQTADPRPRVDFPPEGRKWTPGEQDEIRAYSFAVQRERRDSLPVLQAIQGATAALHRALNDTDVEAQLVARRALVELGYTRVKLLRRAGSVPPALSAVLPANEDPILQLFTALIPDLDRGLRDPELRIRLATIGAVEMLAYDAVLALDVLDRALSDRDLFVRWAAVRSLGRIDPEMGARLVPKIARLLYDPDLNVRMMVASTMDRYGPHAIAALPDLRRTVSRGDPELRTAAITALRSMGPAAARSAIPTLIEALSDQTGTVRRAAAEALGHFGPQAAEAVPALTRLEESDEADDRHAATHAILRILPAPK